MSKLLRAGIFRFMRSKWFWLALTASFVEGLVLSEVFDSLYDFDDFYIMPIFVIYSVFVSLLVGREYSEGTCRNKVITGKSKRVIFFSELILNVGACVLMFLVCILTFVCYCLIAKPPRSFAGMQMVVLGFFLLNVSCAVIFTVLSLLIQSRAIGSVVCLAFFFAMMLGCSMMDWRLGQPAKIEWYEVNRDGSEIVHVEKNLAYSGGVKGKVYKLANSILPYGQFLGYVAVASDYVNYWNNPVAIEATVDYDTEIREEYDAIERNYPVFSLMVIIFLPVVGAFIYEKRDMK